MFALEHGLDLTEELPGLDSAVREALADGPLPTDSWLPVVVYAAEVGYQYEGDRFWPVFAEKTPQWKQRGVSARAYIRGMYERFAEAYGGAVPSGAWTEWFRNIAWPITHAVLPTDLQRHFARLLYDYRRALTADLLRDHEALGLRLARRSDGTSERFKKFAENTGLLGLVASSLLLGDDEEPTLLLQSTLHRVVADLSRERQAAAWLRDAKKAAVSVRLRGLATTHQGERPSPKPTESDEIGWPRLDLELSLRRIGGDWCAYVAVPSHESLGYRFPNIRYDLERVRYRIQGVEGVRPRGALMYRQEPRALRAWPVEDKPVLSAEGGSDALSQALVDHCRLPEGPWLFRLREAGLGLEVRTNLVRPGEDYILLTRESPASVSDLMEPVSLVTVGIQAFRMKVPSEVDGPLIEDLRGLGVGVVSDVHVWPAGLVPASWDGEGRATWPAGECPVIGVQSSRHATSCVVTTEVELADLQWPADSGLLFFQLLGLNAGSHRVEVRLLEGTDETPIAEGYLEVQILEPADSSSSAGARQGLKILSHPARPTLEEVWSGAASIVADGPFGEKVGFSASLLTRGGRKKLASRSFSSTLPIDGDRWQELFSSAKGSGGFSHAFDEAEELVVVASNPVLGSTEVRAQRPFTPLRWCFRIGRDGSFARLIDHIGSDDLVIEYYDAFYPAQCVEPELEGDEEYRTINGGLIVATSFEFSSSLVLPPLLSGGLEALKRLKVRPSLTPGPPTTGSIRKMIDLSRLWTRGATPADHSAEMLQTRINEAIVAKIVDLVDGGKWSDVESQRLDGRPPDVQELVNSVGHRPVERSSAEALLERVHTVGSDPADRAAAFAEVLTLHPSGWRDSLADPVLRLATVPGSLPTDDEGTIEAVEAVRGRPALLRLARLFALALATNDNGSGSVSLRSWPWN